VVQATHASPCRRVVVRLHDFGQLENFLAAWNTSLLECELQRGESEPPAQVCRLDNVRVDALSRAANYFEIALPAVLSVGDAIEIRWVDQWR